MPRRTRPSPAAATRPPPLSIAATGARSRTSIGQLVRELGVGSEARDEGYSATAARSWSSRTCSVVMSSAAAFSAWRI